MGNITDKRIKNVQFSEEKTTEGVGESGKKSKGNTQHYMLPMWHKSNFKFLNVKRTFSLSRTIAYL